MKMITLKNVSDQNITDYPIAEPDMVNGEVRFDDNGNIESTGKTLIWSLNAGETKAFPDYVANYFIQIFGQKDPTAKNHTLEVVEGEQVETTETAKPAVAGQIICKYCGKSFTSAKGLGLHLSFKHLKEIV